MRQSLTPKPKQYATRSQVTCYCGLWPFPHRHSRSCDDYAADMWQEEHDAREDECLDDPRHGQAGDINRQRPC